MYSGNDSPNRSRRTSISSGLLAGVERHQMLALVGPLSHHHRTVTNPRHPQQSVLNLTKLDPETTNLQLGIPPAQKLQLPIRPPPTMITTAIPPPAVGIGQERRPGAFRIVNVSAAHTHPRENNLARARPAAPVPNTHPRPGSAHY